MKKQLLFIIGFFLLTIISCSKEESNEISISEKEYLVKQTLIEFNNSAVKTGKYDLLITKLSQESLKQEDSQIKLENILREFLGDQTQAFSDIYYQLVATSMTSEEFKSIARQFEDLIVNISTASKDKDGCCSTVIPEVFSYLSDLRDIVCGCDESGAAA
ncbi:hypothetical protein [Aquimarina aggregata]|uniref:hypothetical protein n=1 Tax=Aquimarina aggregata TaxID=1642818 RepID=UPI002491D9D4|nr:hypothetical protein [Aquimarina aggregata]